MRSSQLEAKVVSQQIEATCSPNPLFPPFGCWLFGAAVNAIRTNRWRRAKAAVGWGGHTHQSWQGCRRVAASSTVKVHYEGKLADGTVSIARTRGEPISFHCAA